MTVKEFIKRLIPDSLYLKYSFKKLMGNPLNLRNPKTFNEKLQWLKLYNRNPLYTTLVDKYAVKKWVAEKIGEQYVIPTLGVWDWFEDIDFGELPNQFVLKCTHDSGGLVIVNDKSKLNIEAARKKITDSLNRNFFWQSREWPYKNVPPRIIAEKYMEDSVDGEIWPKTAKTRLETAIRDFKFFCFHGVPKIMYVSRDKAEEPTTDFFDMDFNHLDMRMRDPNSKTLPDKPLNFELMKSLAATLSKGMPHVRADFYEIHGQVYFGEMTFFHNGGFSHIYPRKWESELGEWIDLSRCRCKH